MNQIRNIGKRAASLLLCLVMVLSMFPAMGSVAYATGGDDTRTEITEIRATSNFKSPTYGGDVVIPTFTVTNGVPAYFSTINGGWMPGQLGVGTFPEGDFYYWTQVRLDGDDATKYKFAADAKAYINGEEWEVSQIYNAATYCRLWVSSPTYKLTSKIAEDSNVTWNLDKSTGVLSIKGEGPMPDKTFIDMPWYADRDLIREAVISEGITSIPVMLFAAFPNLAKLTLPGSLKVIPAAAFGGTPLKKIVIPEGVTELQDMAFSYCDELTEISIPSTMTKIGEMALIAKAPERVTVRYNGTEADWAKISIAGDNNILTDGKIIFKEEEQEPAAPTKFTLSASSYTYDGNVKTPTVTVKDADGNTLVKDKDYTVSYASGRKNVGTYKVTVKGKGKYSFTKELTFRINPVKTAIAKLTARSKAFTVKWKKKTAQVNGYQIQYSLKKNFASAKTVNIKSAKTVSTTIKKLKAGKTYYVRVRTYKIVGKTKFYSAWSAAKSIKTKK